MVYVGKLGKKHKDSLFEHIGIHKYVSIFIRNLRTQICDANCMENALQNKQSVSGDKSEKKERLEHRASHPVVDCKVLCDL